MIVGGGLVAFTLLKRLKKAFSQVETLKQDFENERLKNFACSRYMEYH